MTLSSIHLKMKPGTRRFGLGAIIIFRFHVSFLGSNPSSCMYRCVELGLVAYSCSFRRKDKFYHKITRYIHTPWQMTSIGKEACLFNKKMAGKQSTYKQINGFWTHELHKFASRSPTKTMVIWVLLGCWDVHLFSLRISATSVQSCTSICGTGPRCT